MSSTDEKRGRGPYRVDGTGTGDDRIDLLRDPQVAAFMNALSRVNDPVKRESIEWLIRVLARDTRNQRKLK